MTRLLIFLSLNTKVPSVACSGRQDPRRESVGVRSITVRLQDHPTKQRARKDPGEQAGLGERIKTKH
jgi:hypothetical protein